MNTERSPLIILASSLIILLLVACNSLPLDTEQPTVTGDSAQPTPAVVLPQATPSTLQQFPTVLRKQSVVAGSATYIPAQIVEVQIDHVRDLDEILVRPGDRIEIGQPLARLSGHAQELGRNVKLIQFEVDQAEAKLAEVQARTETARQKAISDHQAQVAQAEGRVKELKRAVEEKQRQAQIADAQLAQARATTAYRRRWLETLEPLEDFDPWDDIPYLVGSQTGPQGRRSDLAYREALEEAGYELRLAELTEKIAELEVQDAAARLTQAQSDLEVARATLQSLREPEPSAAIRHPSSVVYQSSIHINELRLEAAQADLERAVVKALVAGQVLDVRVIGIDGDEATVLIRITTEP